MNLSLKFRRGLSLLLVLGMLFFTACTGNSIENESVSPTLSGTSEEGDSSNIEDNNEPLEEGLTGKKYDDGVFLMTKNNVKLLGRTYLNNDVRWCSFSASGVEFKFNGKTCKLSLRADSSVNDTANQARYAIYIDDELFEKDVLDIGIKEIELISADKVEEHVVRVIKISESANSSMGIQYITCDTEATIEPTAEKNLKIEFVGDSITCGYGVDGTINDTFSTHNEDATQAYAYRTAQMLNADYSLVSSSGYGIVSGYTSGSKNEAQTLPQYYDKVGNSYGTTGGIKPSDIDWDFSFTPDIVVINLGTNDNSYTGADSSRKEEYVQAYYSFLETIREKNPDAIIVCALGIMGQELCPKVQETVSRFTEDKGDNKVFYVKLDNQDLSNVVVDWHPSAASHEHAAEQMSEAIKQILEGTYTSAE